MIPQIEPNDRLRHFILTAFNHPRHIGEAFPTVALSVNGAFDMTTFMACVDHLVDTGELIYLPQDEHRLVVATWPKAPTPPAEAAAPAAAVYTSILDPVTCCMMVAHLVAKGMSKDPNTKVGAVVYDPQTKHMHLGYNGFPPGFPDLKEVWDCRDAKAERNKYKFVKHAEANAISKAMQAGADLSRCWLVVTHHPCHRCMVDFVASNGIKKVYYANTYPPDTAADLVAREQGVELIHMEGVMERIKDFVTDMRMFV